MAVTLTYDDTLARVRITATGLAAADYATIERSTDQITWTMVRGATGLTVVAGALAATFDDYEFAPGIANYYRIRGVETGAITVVDRGSTGSGVNASVTPGLPAGMLDGDLMVCFAAIRNSGAGTVNVNVPTGWTLIRAFGNTALFGRRYVTGDVAPTVTFSGGVANADTIARIVAFRRAELTPVTGVDLLNGSAQDIAFPALTVPSDNLLLLDVMWKQDDATTISGRGGSWSGIGSVINSTAGDDMSMYWYYLVQTTATSLTSGTHTVTGGAAAISRATTVAFAHAAYLNSQTGSITPVLTKVWLKSIARPFLNRAIKVRFSGSVETTWPARTGINEVINRSLPVAVNDVRSAPRRPLLVRTESYVDYKTMEYLIASGDVLYLQVPAGLTEPRPGYVTAGDVTAAAHPLRQTKVTWTLPLTYVAAPGPYVVPAVSTWQSVLNAYATWADVIAANPTWADLLARIGDPSEVIVP